MKITRLSIVGAFVGAVVIFGSGYAVAEVSGEAWKSQVQKLAMGGSNIDNETIVKVYSTAVGSPSLTKAAAELAFQWDPKAEPKETSLAVLGVLQNQKLIEQNKEIIELLKKRK